MPKYPEEHYNRFIAIAQECGSGIGRSLHFDGSLKSLAILLRKNSEVEEISEAIAALAQIQDKQKINKLNKYRRAIAYLERTLSIPFANRQAPVGGRSIEAIKYTRSTIKPVATPDTLLSKAGDFMTTSAARSGLGMTVPTFMAKNSMNVGVLMIHLGHPPRSINLQFDGVSSLEHMKAVLSTAKNCRIPTCVLCDPHNRGRGVGTPTAQDAVGDGLKDAVGSIPKEQIFVADGGRNHSAFHDPQYREWLEQASLTSIVVLGYQADICVRGNVFGLAEVEEGSKPRRLVSALINHKDVVTAKPLLLSDDGAIGSYLQWGSEMCSSNRE